MALEYSWQMISQRRREGEEGCYIVSEMKKARYEGKKAFIYGELIVNGKPHKAAAECELFSPGLSPGTRETSTKTRTELTEARVGYNQIAQKTH